MGRYERKLCADITQLKEDTGFASKVTFDKGIFCTVQWCITTQEK